VAEGAKVVITGRNQATLDAAAAELGPNAFAVVADATDVAATDAAIGKGAEKFGKYDILFANAGIAGGTPLGATDIEAFQKVVSTNLTGVFFTVQSALPHLNDNASIILNGSVASVKGTAAFGVYAASKAALRSFVRTWTTDLKDRRIRSNVVSPGPINTPLASRQAADVIARMVSTIPMGRMGEPEEVAKVALFLASDDSSFVTGIELFVDGGRAQV
jgi:NAD(P)-dependent dehydrogenase (short-subunit alcohol dehydrogenase family)